MVRQLRDEPRRSRNRHFEELSRPVVLRARKLLRRLESLARELKSGAAVRVRPHDGGIVVVIDQPAVRVRRTAWLTREEHALLREDPTLERLLTPG